jgi:hypothetical protein
MAPQKQRKTVTSQTQLMITTKRQFSWKHNAVEYLLNTLTNLHVKCQVLVIQHEHECKYMHIYENFLKSKGRYYNQNSTASRPNDLNPKVTL